MALSFPPSPAIGDIYLQWQWNGSAWGPISGGAGSGGSVSITAGTGVIVTPSPLTGTGTVALATMAANSLKGNNTGAAAAAADLTVAQTMTLLGAAPLASPTFTGVATAPQYTSLGAGQSSAAINTGGALGGAILLADSAAGLGNGGAVVFSASGASWRFAAIKGLVGDAGGNSTGDVYISTRRVATDATLTAAVRIDFAGNCFNTTGSWGTISSAQFKLADSIKPYETGLAEICALRPVEYRYAPGTLFAPTDEPGPLRYGLIAEEVEPVIPEIVGTTNVLMRDKEQEVQYINSGDLIYSLINAIKTLAERLTAAEARITSQSLAKR